MSYSCNSNSLSPGSTVTWLPRNPHSEEMEAAQARLNGVRYSCSDEIHLDSPAKLITAELDLGFTRWVRHGYGFFNHRRPETYGALMTYAG